ncbi:MAG: hypothetical protein HRK26_03275 [Rickettsiaceae bacterium H1]|nr:hypothetical protein [Rickettsiaceae bacterium H1]
MGCYISHLIRRKLKLDCGYTEAIAAADNKNKEDKQFFDAHDNTEENNNSILDRQDPVSEDDERYYLGL